VVPIVEDKALSIGMPRHHRHLHFGLFADPAALPAAARLPNLLAEEVRAFGDARSAQNARRPVVAVRARPALTAS
jgi:hypothetical protein